MVDMFRVLSVGGPEIARINREIVDITAMTQTICEEVRRRDPDRQAEFVIAQGVVAEGDRLRLREALENLLHNSWKFTKENTEARIEFGITQREDEKVYFVRDNGSGFDMREADRLFVAFEWLYPATEYESMGIGLAPVKRIVECHGGRVWAEAAVEQGATFYVTLG